MLGFLGMVLLPQVISQVAFASFGFAPIEMSLRNQWFRYWEQRASPEVKFDLHPEQIEKAVFLWEGVGTAFYISTQGHFLTNRHVVEALCPLPEQGARGVQLPCLEGKYIIEAFPTKHWGRSAQVDAVLMRQPTEVLATGEVPLSLRLDPVQKGERVFLVSFPSPRCQGEDEDGEILEMCGRIARNLPFPVLYDWIEDESHAPLQLWSEGRVTALEEGTISTSDRNLSAREKRRFAKEEGLSSAYLRAGGSATSLDSYYGSSGAPLLDQSGRVIGVWLAEDTAVSITEVVSELGL